MSIVYVETKKQRGKKFCSRKISFWEASRRGVFLINITF